MDYIVNTGAGLTDAINRLSPGDTLAIQEHVQHRPYYGTFAINNSGTQEQPITIVGQGAVLGAEWIVNGDYVHLEGMHWTGFDDGLNVGQSRDENRPVVGLSIVGCTWMHGVSGVRLWHVKNSEIRNVHFRDIRSRVAGVDSVALIFKRSADNVLVDNCLFEDIGSDGIHIAPNAPVTGRIENIRIVNCKGWINRPYGNVEWQDYSSNVGENFIDVKGQLTNNVHIERCEGYGFRPTVEGQDASGEQGSIVRIHYGASNVYVDNCHLHDSDYGVIVSYGTDGLGVTGPVWLRGNTFANISQRDILIHEGLEVHVIDVWPPLNPDLENAKAEIALAMEHLVSARLHLDKMTAN